MSLQQRPLARKKPEGLTGLQIHVVVSVQLPISSNSVVLGCHHRTDECDSTAPATDLAPTVCVHWVCEGIEDGITHQFLCVTVWGTQRNAASAVGLLRVRQCQQVHRPFCVADVTKRPRTQRPSGLGLLFAIFAASRLFCLPELTRARLTVPA